MFRQWLKTSKHFINKLSTINHPRFHKKHKDSCSKNKIFSKKLISLNYYSHKSSVKNSHNLKNNPNILEHFISFILSTIIHNFKIT